MVEKSLSNYFAGEWQHSKTSESLAVHDPATAEILTRVPLSTTGDVNSAVKSAHAAFREWRRTPPTQRIQYLFKLKNLLEEHFDEIARVTTQECGKTLAESRGELRRGIENVEVATGIPSLMMGDNLEDVARGIDEHMIRQPVGVVAAITPFNFPTMIPLWFIPYAIACGNTFILKPSEKVPVSSKLIFDMIDQIDLPTGVINLVNGSKETVDALLDHPMVRAISFVGSSPVAKYIYTRGAAAGKKVQCQGGAKNVSIILPDAEPTQSTEILAESAFGCAGQRCLASSIAVTVGDSQDWFTQRIVEAARSRKVGYGLDPDIEMGPVITSQSKERIENLVSESLDQGNKILVDGRQTVISGYDNGNFIRPTIMESSPSQEILKTEIFGPVLSVIPTQTIDEAISVINTSNFGNMACLFTKSGTAARKFRYEAQAGNIGINVGVAAPMAFFPFCGWKESFYGDLHGQGRDAIDFYTEKKVVVERWLD